MTPQKYHVTEEGDLVIQNITKEDKGNYKCKATQLENGFTDFGWRVIQLKVERKKMIVITFISNSQYEITVEWIIILIP